MMIELKLTEEEIQEQLFRCAICCASLVRVGGIVKHNEGSALVCRQFTTSEHFGTTRSLPIPTECLGLSGLRLRRRSRDWPGHALDHS
jgi:hypothetical protein